MVPQFKWQVVKFYKNRSKEKVETIEWTPKRLFENGRSHNGIQIDVVDRKRIEYMFDRRVSQGETISKTARSAEEYPIPKE